MYLPYPASKTAYTLAYFSIPMTRTPHWRCCASEMDEVLPLRYLRMLKYGIVGIYRANWTNVS